MDEMDYLITRNQEVLYDLFQLPTYPNSCCILMGEIHYITETYVCKMYIFKSAEKHPILSINILVDLRLRLVIILTASCLRVASNISSSFI